MMRIPGRQPMCKGLAALPKPKSLARTSRSEPWTITRGFFDHVLLQSFNFPTSLKVRSAEELACQEPSLRCFPGQLLASLWVLEFHPHRRRPGVRGCRDTWHHKFEEAIQISIKLCRSPDSGVPATSEEMVPWPRKGWEQALVEPEQNLPMRGVCLGLQKHNALS